ncbi:MAG: hypothetical protein ACRYFU_17400 [Janthinobacterium lividum]
MSLRSGVLRCVLLAGSVVLVPGARAQHGGGAPGGGGGMGPGGPPGGMGGMGRGGDSDFGRPRGGPPPGNTSDATGMASTMRGGLQLGPPGRWWDDKHFAKDLKLRPDQQRHMDLYFEESRQNLLRRHDAFELEENRMESLTHAKTLDEASLFTQIDRLTQARAELEKVTTHLLLQIRNEMDADQIARLEQHR